MTTPQVERETWVPEITFGARLALVRHRMGWNIKEAAQACGLPAQSWRGWELDGREPHRLVTIAMTIAQRTGVDYLWLCHGPGRGQQGVTQFYVPSRQRVLTTVGAGRPADGSSSVHSGQYTRAVRQTRPVVGRSIRPVSPVAV